MLGVVGSIVDTDREDWDRTVAVLLTSVFLGIKHGARVMRPQGAGAIVNTASTAGVRGGLGPHAYAAAKHAVVGLTISAAVELMPTGIRVNAIAPGATVSGITAGVVAGDPTALEQVEERLAGPGWHRDPCEGTSRCGSAAARRARCNAPHGRATGSCSARPAHTRTSGPGGCRSCSLSRDGTQMPFQWRP